MGTITTVSERLLQFAWAGLIALILSGCNMPINLPPVVITAMPMQVNLPTPPPTPASRFGDMPPGSVNTRVAVGNIPANTPIRISSLRFEPRLGWIYQIATLDDKQFADVAETDLVVKSDYNPAQSTPAARYEASEYWSECYILITTEDLPLLEAPAGTSPVIPAGSRVRIGGMLADAYYLGNGQWAWFYDVAQEGGLYAARAREDQLAPAPGVDPQAMTGPTPTPPFALVGGGYNYVTREDVGAIKSGTLVLLGSARVGCTEWLVWINTQDGRSAEARASQIEPIPGFDPDAPTPTLLPVPPTP